MSTEEKAKAYDEALERAKKAYQNIKPENTAVKAILEEAFPELRESEDERIRKYLIEELKAAKSVGELKFVIPQPTKEECIAYLENQKESLHITETCKENADSFTDSVIEIRSFQRGLEEGRRQEQEKQKKQKPTDLPPGFYFIDLDGNRYYSKEFRYGDMKMKVVEQKPAELNNATINGEPIPTENQSVDIPLAEWSEEDEKYLSQAIETLEHENYIVLAEKLKSLRPSWKPSEEQIEAFRSYIKDFQEKAEAAVGGWNNFDVMIRLFEQLKKLV